MITVPPAARAAAPRSTPLAEGPATQERVQVRIRRRPLAGSGQATGRVQPFALAGREGPHEEAHQGGIAQGRRRPPGSLASSAAKAAATCCGRSGGLRLRGAVIPGQVQLSVSGSPVAHTRRRQSAHSQATSCGRAGSGWKKRSGRSGREGDACTSTLQRSQASGGAIAPRLRYFRT